MDGWIIIVKHYVSFQWSSSASWRCLWQRSHWLHFLRSSTTSSSWGPMPTSSSPSSGGTPPTGPPPSVCRRCCLLFIWARNYFLLVKLWILWIKNRYLVWHSSWTFKVLNPHQCEIFWICLPGFYFIYYNWNWLWPLIFDEIILQNCPLLDELHLS